MHKKNPLTAFSDLIAGLLGGWTCLMEGQPVPTSALEVGADQVEPFVREHLLNQDRVLPILLLGPGKEVTNIPLVELGLGKELDDVPPESAENVLQSRQAQLIGLAWVVGLHDQATASRLAELLGSERACEGDTMRLYWPGFTRDSIPDAHPFHRASSASHARTLFQELYMTLASLSGSVYREGAVIRAARAALARERISERRAATTAIERLAATETDLRQARQAREEFRRERDEALRQLAALRRELEEVRTQLAAFQEADDRPPQREQEIAEFEAELERVWDENARLRAEVEAARRQINELEIELSNARENLVQLWEAQSAPADIPAPAAGERDFTDVIEALRAAAVEFNDVLVIWESALRSAEESLFASPSQVFRALRAIAEVGRDYFSARAGGPPLGPMEQAFRNKVPFKYTSFESQTTLGLFGADRVFRHGEQSRQMQRHLTLGGGQTNNCLQIYFEFDDANRRVLIGYCGRHLPFHRQRT
jgi:hypothetical protein